MPQAAALAVLLVVAFASGVLLARWLAERANHAERLRLEEEMTARVQERYQAFLGMETQVRGIFGRLDELENATARRLVETGMHIRTLGSALAAYEGREQPPDPPQPAAGLSWMDSADGEIHAAGVSGPARRQFSGWPSPEPVDIAEWERKLELVRQEKHAEIDRQGQVISELSERLKGLEPQAERNKRLERELALWQEKYMRLEQETTGGAAEIEGCREDAQRLRERIAELEGCIEGMQRADQILGREKDERAAELEGEVAKLRSSQREGLDEIAGLHAECAGLRAELAEAQAGLGRLRSECEAAGEGAATWERRCNEMEAERPRLIAELERLRLERHESSERLRTVEQALEESAARLFELEERRAAQVVELNERCAEAERALQAAQGACEDLVTEVGALRQENLGTLDRLAASERALEESGKRLFEREGLHAAEVAELHRQHEEVARALGTSRATSEGLESERARQEEFALQLEDELQRRAERIGELEDELLAIEQRVVGQGTRISTLMAELDGVRQDGERLRQEAQAKGSLVDAAESVLAELRPKLEALETQLHQRRG